MLSTSVTFFDLSNLYGAGRAEIILANGSALSDKDFHSIKYTTKAGLLPHKGFEMPFDYSYNHINVEIQRSIERLQGPASIPIFLFRLCDIISTLISPATYVINWLVMAL